MTDPNSNHDVIETNIDYFVTTTTLKRSVSVEALMEALRLRRTTGDLCFHLVQGGVRRIELNERKALNDAKSDQVREILDMD